MSIQLFFLILFFHTSIVFLVHILFQILIFPWQAICIPLLFLSFKICFYISPYTFFKCRFSIWEKTCEHMVCVFLKNFSQHLCQLYIKERKTSRIYKQLKGRWNSPHVIHSIIGSMTLMACFQRRKHKWSTNILHVFNILTQEGITN